MRAVWFHALVAIVLALHLAEADATTKSRPEAVATQAACAEALAKLDKVSRRVGTVNGSLDKPGACTTTAAERRVDDIASLIEAKGIKAPEPAAPARLPAQAPAAPVAPPTDKVPGDGFEAQVEVSVITPEKARELFARIKMLKNTLLLEYPELPICSQRAHIISKRLEENHKVITGKIWMKPGVAGGFDPMLAGETERKKRFWDYHVAPFVLVDVGNGKKETWVLDPVVDDRHPLKQEDWEKRITSKPSWNNVYRTNRHIYRDKDIFLDIKSSQVTDDQAEESARKRLSDERKMQKR